MDIEKVVLHGTLKVCKMSPEQIEKIIAAFEKEYNTKVVLTIIEDEKIIGGFIAEVGGKVYDASVLGKINSAAGDVGAEKAEESGEKVDGFFANSAFRVYYSGTVSSSADGIVWIDNFEGRHNGELLEFENNVLGMALELKGSSVGAVLFSGADMVSAGSKVHGSGKVVRIPVGDALLGRVINPLGQPLDGEELHINEYAPVEKPAPSIIQRQAVNRPLDTGILMIDSMIPIGRGQRELIIGDRQTGKTQIALDTMLSQKNTGVISIYCAIGQKASTVAQVIETLKEYDAMKNSIVLSATASDAPAMQYIAPYAACSIGEHFMEQGRDVLIVFDDLSKHAIAYRTISLLLQRPPGREAYPGDIFYLHSRLLERSAHMSDEMGGGSITALPIVETLAGDISAYVPTNIISITDGQIFLEEELFYSGIRPAVNVGLSVSRVGRSAQHPAMRKVSNRLRIELAQYRELAVFSQFGSDVDAPTKEKLDRGIRLTQILKQNKNSPRTLSQQVSLLLAFNEGLLSDILLSDLPEFITKMLSHFSTYHRAEMDLIDESGDMDDDMKKILLDNIRAFKAKGDVKS